MLTRLFDRNSYCTLIVPVPVKLRTLTNEMRADVAVTLESTWPPDEGLRSCHRPAHVAAPVKNEAALGLNDVPLLTGEMKPFEQTTSEVVVPPGKASVNGSVTVAVESSVSVSAVPVGVAW